MEVHKNAAAKRVKTPKAKSGKVETVKVDKRVMREAKRRAKQDAKLLKIKSRIRVEVKDDRYDPPR